MHLCHGYKMVYEPNYPRANFKGYIYEHVLIAEKTLGKPLPKGAEVHHYGKRNDNTQIVICQDRAYHFLLHKRMRALEACGHVSWRKCTYCKQYDEPENLYIKGRTVYHRACRVEYNKKNKVKIVVYQKEYYQKTKIKKGGYYGKL